MNNLKKLGKSLITSVLAVLCTLGLASIAIAATVVNLGTADDFAILAGTAITDTGTSVISGNVGLSPDAGSNYDGLTIAEVTGTIYAVDATGPAGIAGNNAGLVNSAKSALVTAYDNAAAQTPVSPVATELGGTTKFAGVYDSASGTFGITAASGTLILDGQGDSNAVFIFKTTSTLTAEVNSEVVLTNGAQACNVFWQVGSSATLKTSSIFKGNILALTAITLQAGVNVEGRLLARNAAVTLNTSIVNKATCVIPPATDAAPRRRIEPAPAPLPFINVLQTSQPLDLPLGPGTVTYTYIVTNPGKVSMNDVWVKDNTCSSVKFISGDENGDSKLDIDESWIYSCAKTVSETETNTATAHGSANNGDVWNTANATVFVGVSLIPQSINLTKKPTVPVLLTDVVLSTPSFPKTGLSPKENNTPWNIFSRFVRNLFVDIPVAGPKLPLRLKIPNINVDATIESIGLTVNGAMDVPKNPVNAALFDGGPRPGEEGSSVINGHFGWIGRVPAVFDNLDKLRKGDKVYVEDEKGVTITFVVRELVIYGENDDAHTAFNSSDGRAHLNLITCIGTWDPTEQNYSNRLVVFTDRE
ncbi:MAG: ice-binding family protein [bacterium]|nr:ice-binding family protein [bacterium]